MLLAREDIRVNQRDQGSLRPDPTPTRPGSGRGRVGFFSAKTWSGSKKAGVGSGRAGSGSGFAGSERSLNVTQTETRRSYKSYTLLICTPGSSSRMCGTRGNYYGMIALIYTCPEIHCELNLFVRINITKFGVANGNAKSKHTLVK